MSKEVMQKKIAEGELEKVSGGVTRDLQAAYDCIQGRYGNGQDRINNLRRNGYDPETVQYLVNAVLSYGQVAQDVINGRYGTGQARVDALTRAGYPAFIVQDLVNNMLG